MKVMLLAAGKGERMRPLTEKTPKPLLQAGGKPLIVWHLQNLASAGFTDIVINHAWLGEQLEKELGSGEKFGVSIQYSAEGEPLETAGGIQRALPLLGEKPFLVVNADIWTDYSFTGLRNKFLGNNLCYLVMVPNAPHHPDGDFVLQQGFLYRPESKAEVQTCTYSGIGLYSPELFAGLKPGKQALLPLLNTAINAGRSGAELFAGDWRDIGTPERLAELNHFLN